MDKSNSNGSGDMAGNAMDFINKLKDKYIVTILTIMIIGILIALVFFYYGVFNLENMGGMFSNEGQLLNQFSINYTGKKVIFNFEDYILFDSKHKLPRLLNISLDDNSSFKIRTLSVKSFNVKPNYFKKKRKKVYQQLQKNKNQESKPIMIAPFLF